VSQAAVLVIEVILCLCLLKRCNIQVEIALLYSVSVRGILKDSVGALYMLFNIFIIQKSGG
jgi:hypothetical protein